MMIGLLLSLVALGVPAFASPSEPGQGTPPPATPAVQAPGRAGAAGPPAAVLAEAYFLFLQARTLEERGDIPGATEAYRRAVALVPDSADLRAEFAAFHAGQGRAADAVSEAEAALRVDPAHGLAHRIMGLVQAAVSERIASPTDAASMRDEAIGHFEQAVEAGARDPLVQFTLGSLYVARGRFDRGIETLKRFLLDQPGYPDAMMLLAQAYGATGRTDEAIAVLEDIALPARDDARPRELLGDLYEQAGRWADAAGVWAALGDRAGPRAAFYRLRRATALANGGDLGAARAILVLVTEEAPAEVMAWSLLTQIDLRLGNVDAAEAAARQIRQVAPNDPRGLLSLADVQAARGDLDGVVSTLEPRVNAPAPDDLRDGMHGRLAGTMAAALFEKGDLSRAVEVMEAARRRTPADDDLLYNLGTTYERADRGEDAEAAFRELIARAPGHADALNFLGYMLADQGEQLDEALGLIHRALEIEPDNPSYLDSLGWAYFRQGNYRLAREPLERAAAAMTTASIVQDHLGDLYFQLKLYREAAAAYDRALAGDMDGVELADVTRKRNRARELAGR